MSLNRLVEEFLLERGALKVGVATVETLADGPPSVDLGYRLEGARSSVSFALPMEKDSIRLLLSKADREPHEKGSGVKPTLLTRLLLRSRPNSVVKSVGVTPFASLASPLKSGFLSPGGLGFKRSQYR